MLNYWEWEYGGRSIIEGLWARKLLPPPKVIWGAHLIVSDDQLDKKHTIAVLTAESALVPVEQYDGDLYHRLAEVTSIPGEWTEITFTPLSIYAHTYRELGNLIHLGSYEANIPGLVAGDALALSLRPVVKTLIPIAIGVIGLGIVVALILKRR